MSLKHIEVTSIEQAKALKVAADLLPENDQKTAEAMRQAADAFIDSETLHIYTPVSYNDADCMAYVGSCLDWTDIEQNIRTFCPSDDEIYAHFAGGKGPSVAIVRKGGEWTLSVNGLNFDLPPNLRMLEQIEGTSKVCFGDGPVNIE